MDFCGRFIVAKTLAEPAIGGRYQRPYAAAQRLRWAGDRPAMYPPTPVHRNPAQPTPPPPVRNTVCLVLMTHIQLIPLIFAGFKRVLHLSDQH